MGETTTESLGDRPSRHGKLLGEALADIAEAGRVPGAPDLCATCAFRRGSLPNQTAGTGKLALDILLGIDTADFACHHGMKDGAPLKLCVGGLLAKRVAFEAVREHLARLHDRLEAMSGEDEVRLAFDRWWRGVDPEMAMDVYELASTYARAHGKTALAPPAGSTPNEGAFPRARALFTEIVG